MCCRRDGNLPTGQGSELLFVLPQPIVITLAYFEISLPAAV